MVGGEEVRDGRLRILVVEKRTGTEKPSLPNTDKTNPGDGIARQWVNTVWAVAHDVYMAGQLLGWSCLLALTPICWVLVKVKDFDYLQIISSKTMPTK